MSFAFNIPFNVERKPAWVNPYVTDGLVAMWDGEWNAGGGVHDASASEWTDLVGGGGNITLASNYQWEADALVHKSAGSAAIQSANAISEFETVEFVCAIPTFANGEYFGIGDEGVKSAGVVWWQNGVGFSRKGASNTGFQTSLLASASVSAVAAFNITSAYINGAETQATLGSASSWQGIFDRWSVGGNRYHPSAEFRLKCVRIYNRTLATSEILSNYDMDKARFNI